MVLIFAGAGASKALNKDEYPTTVEFFDLLPEDVRAAPLFGQVRAFLQGGDQARVLDIEQVLWTLHEWRVFAGAGLSAGSFPGWLLNKRRLQALPVPDRFDPRPSIDVLRAIDGAAERLASQINEHVYTLYRRAPTETELGASWLPLLRGALEYTSRVDVFTTNYDLVLETAIALGGLGIETGRSREVTPRLQVDLWDTTRSELVERRTGLLTKLHGSIDWIRGDQGDIYCGTPQFTGQHDQRAIIYPGFKGVAEQRPFSHFHDYLRTAADQASAAIFIGFAFRDEHINAIARERLRSGVPILVIGLGDHPPDIPFRSGQYKYVGGGFTPAAVEEAVHWLGTLEA